MVEWKTIVGESGVWDQDLTILFWFLQMFSGTWSRTSLFFSSNLTQRPVGVVVEWKTMVGESGVRDPSLTLYFFLEISSNSFKNYTLFSIESYSKARWISGRVWRCGWKVWGSRPASDTWFFLKFPVFDSQEPLSLLFYFQAMACWCSGRMKE